VLSYSIQSQGFFAKGLHSKMFHFLIASIVSALLVCASPVASQTAPEGPATQGSDESPADQAFEPISKKIKLLFDSLRSKGGAGPEDRPLIESLREQVAAFSKQFPNDLRGPATALTLSGWLGDEDRVEQLYADLMRIAPDKMEIRLGWIDRLKAHNRYADAIKAIQSANIDPAKHPQAYLTLSECLFAENRFQEALDALNAIPESTLAEQTQIKAQVDEAKSTREEYIKLWQSEESLRAQEAAADDLPRAMIKTADGSILVELFENDAPNTVANFISLIEQGFYNGIKFHRVLPNFMAQGGDPNSRDGAIGTPGEGGPGYNIPDEHDKDEHRKHFAGSLAMANTGSTNSGGSQFYLTHAPTPWLNGRHTVFGRVLEGMDVVRRIKQNDVIESITIVRKREHAYVPNTLPLPGAATQPTPPETSDDTAPPTTAPTTQADESDLAEDE
jgi:cyclophilin family peptidyl-prolyl cis-trans isomerase